MVSVIVAVSPIGDSVMVAVIDSSMGAAPCNISLPNIPMPPPCSINSKVGCTSVRTDSGVAVASFLPT